MKYYVKAFYPGLSVQRKKDDRIIACILYTSENKHEAERICYHLRRTNVADGLVFTHDENGRGTTTLETHSLVD